MAEERIQLEIVFYAFLFLLFVQWMYRGKIFMVFELKIFSFMRFLYFLFLTGDYLLNFLLGIKPELPASKLLFRFELPGMGGP